MNIFVMHIDGGGWAVKRADSEEIVSSHDTKHEAIEVAKEIAVGSDAGIVILRADGTIDNIGLYGIDPFPSEDNAAEFNDEQDEEG